MPHDPGIAAQLGGLALEVGLIVAGCAVAEEVRRWLRWRRFGRYLEGMRRGR